MSVHLKCLQGSPEWRLCRMGLPTASEFHRLVTPKKLEISKSGIASMAAEIIAERALMQPLEIDLAGFAERGDLLEQEAVPWYKFQRDVEVDRDGFYFDPDLMAGASPDGITPTSGLEIKSLAPAKHLRYLLGDAPADYMAQVQGCMWICGRGTWDLLFYHPTLPSKILTIERDEEYISTLQTALDGLGEAIDKMMTLLKDEGVNFVPWAEHVIAMKKGELPQEQINRPKRFDLWSGPLCPGRGDGTDLKQDAFI